MKAVLRFALIAMFGTAVAFAQTPQKTKPVGDDMKDCPMHAEHAKHAAASDHAAGVDARGDQAMGFSHETTNHHFRSKDDGGSIEATVKDSADTASLTQIRTHMKDIAR